jgi:hypothetical protein
MPSPSTTQTAIAPPLSAAGASTVCKAAFWDRIARKYAAGPIAGYEATLRLAPFTWHLLANDVSAGMITIARGKLAAQPVPQLNFAVTDADAPVSWQPGKHGRPRVAGRLVRRLETITP